MSSEEAPIPKYKSAEFVKMIKKAIEDTDTTFLQRCRTMIEKHNEEHVMYVLAARKKNMKILHWLVENNWKKTTNVILNCVEMDTDLKMFEWFLKHNFPCDKEGVLSSSELYEEPFPTLIEEIIEKYPNANYV